MPASNPTVARRAAPEEAASGSAIGSVAHGANLGEWAYALPLAALVTIAILVLIAFRIADFRFVVSGAVAAG